MISEFNSEQHARYEAEAATNPEKYRTSRLIKRGLNMDFRYFTCGKNGKGQSVYWCYMTVPNIAGFYLSFKETHKQNGKVVRTAFKGHKTEGGANTQVLREANSVARSNKGKR